MAAVLFSMIVTFSMHYLNIFLTILKHRDWFFEISHPMLLCQQSSWLIFPPILGNFYNRNLYKNSSIINAIIFDVNNSWATFALTCTKSPLSRNLRSPGEERYCDYLSTLFAESDATKIRTNGDARADQSGVRVRQHNQACQFKMNEQHFIMIALLA